MSLEGAYSIRINHFGLLQVSRFPLRLTLADLQRYKDSADVALAGAHLGKRKIIDSKVPLKGAMLIPRQVHVTKTTQQIVFDTTDGINMMR